MALVFNPGCGMLFQPTDVATRCRYRGLTFDPCSHACLEKFLAEPERYMVERQAVGQVAAQQPVRPRSAKAGLRPVLF